MEKKDKFFDIVEMIKAFSMEDFFKDQEKGKYNSGYLLITNSQYILGYNRGYGEGGHSEALAKSFYAARGIDRELTEDEYWLIEEDLSTECIEARLVNELSYGTYILFQLSNLYTITPNQYALFLKFYDKYNDVIKEVSKRLDRPIVRIGLPLRMTSRNDYDLTFLLSYFQTIIDKEKYLPDDEQIIGEALDMEKRR